MLLVTGEYNRIETDRLLPHRMSPHFSLQTDKRHTHRMWQYLTQINDHDWASFDVMYTLHNSRKETTDWNHRIQIFPKTAHFDRVTHRRHSRRRPQGTWQLLSFIYRYLTRSQAMTTRITTATTDNSRHMHEQPPLVRLFRIASLFCTRWMRRILYQCSIHANLRKIKYQVAAKYFKQG